MRTACDLGGARLRRWSQPPALALIVLGSVLAAALLVGVAVVAGHGANQTVESAAHDRVRSNRDAAVRAVTRQAEDFKRTVVAYAAEAPVIAALTPGSGQSTAVTRARLSLLAQSKQSPAAFVSDLAGRNRVIYPDQPELQGKDFSFRDWFQGVSRTGAPYVSQGYRSAAAGQPLVVAVSAPVLSGTQRVGYLTVLWQLESVRAIVEGAQKDDGITLTVADQAGQSLAGPLAVDGRGQPVPPGERSSDRGQVKSLTSSGVVPELGWTVTAALPTSLAVAQAAHFRDSLLITLALSLLLVLAFVVAAALLARRRAGAQAALDRERRRLTALFGDSPIGILECRADGAVVAVNDALLGMLGYDRADLIGAQARDLLEPSTEKRIGTLEGLLTGHPGPRGMSRLYRAKDGTLVPASVSVIMLREPGSDALRFVAFVVDEREQKRAEAALRSSEGRFRQVFDEGLVGKLLVASDGSVLRVNATLARQVGRDLEDFVGEPLLARFTDPADQDRVRELVQAGTGELRGEMAMAWSHGEMRWGLVALAWLTEADGQRLLLVQVEDVTARRAAEAQLTELALHDALTGLPNRRLLLERCAHAFAGARSGRGHDTGVAALFLDLDGFKPVNDRYGHAHGDQLLVAIATRLQAAVRPGDTVARVGGDEFVVLLDRDDGLDHLRGLADRLVKAVSSVVVAGDGLLKVTASIGIARVDLVGEPSVTPDQLLRRADAAMYRAKERGRDRHDVFDEELHDAGEARLLLEQTVREGLLHDRVQLAFQAVVEVDTGAVVGAEALMRLSTAEGRIVPALPAILAAENAGLVEAVGERVLDLALRVAAGWPAGLSIAVNISARELTGRDLQTRVLGALDRHGVDPSRLVLEITESSVLGAGPSALAALGRLREHGVKVAIDDFGTAYATLQNLTRLPVDMLKIDAGFTAGLPDQRTHVAVVNGIASMARELGIPAVVEGIENESQLAAVRGLGLLAQGWLWGDPQGADTVPAMARAGAAPRVVPAREHPARLSVVPSSRAAGPRRSR